MLDATAPRLPRAFALTEQVHRAIVAMHTNVEFCGIVAPIGIVDGLRFDYIFAFPNRLEGATPTKNFVSIAVTADRRIVFLIIQLPQNLVSRFFSFGEFHVAPYLVSCPTLALSRRLP
jgi:hypothetical protein